MDFLLQRMIEIEKYCSPDVGMLSDIAEAYNNGMNQVVQDWVDQFPTQDQLMAQLVEKLKGKSVYHTLKAISEGKVDSPDRALKGLFSLGTHIAIELEQGNKEFGMLLPALHVKIGKLIVGE